MPNTRNQHGFYCTLGLVAPSFSVSLISPIIAETWNALDFYFMAQLSFG